MNLIAFLLCSDLGDETIAPAGPMSPENAAMVLFLTFIPKITPAKAGEIAT